MQKPAADTVRVFDTWVEGKKGTIHFDVMTTDEETALRLGKEYLASIGEPDATITPRNVSSATTNRSSSSPPTNSASSANRAASS